MIRYVGGVVSRIILVYVNNEVIRTMTEKPLTLRGSMWFDFEHTVFEVLGKDISSGYVLLTAISTSGEDEATR